MRDKLTIEWSDNDKTATIYLDGKEIDICTWMYPVENRVKKESDLRWDYRYAKA